MQLRLHEVIRVWISRSKELCGQNRRGHQVDDRYAAPHERASALLIFENGYSEMARRREVHRIHDTFGEHKKSGEDVARKCRKKKI